MAVDTANQPPLLRDYNIVAANAPLLEALRREGAAAAKDDVLAFGAELGGDPLEWGRLRCSRWGSVKGFSGRARTWHAQRSSWR